MPAIFSQEGAIHLVSYWEFVEHLAYTQGYRYHYVEASLFMQSFQHESYRVESYWWQDTQNEYQMLFNRAVVFPH